MADTALSRVFTHHNLDLSELSSKHFNPHTILFEENGFHIAVGSSSKNPELYRIGMRWMHENFPNFKGSPRYFLLPVGTKVDMSNCLSAQKSVSLTFQNPDEEKHGYASDGLLLKCIPTVFNASDIPFNSLRELKAGDTVPWGIGNLKKVRVGMKGYVLVGVDARQRHMPQGEEPISPGLSHQFVVNAVNSEDQSAELSIVHNFLDDTSDHQPIRTAYVIEHLKTYSPMRSHQYLSSKELNAIDAMIQEGIWGT